MSSQKGFVWFEAESMCVVLEIQYSCVGKGFVRCAVDYSIFIKKSSTGFVFLVVYVDDILLIGSDTTGINETKQYLSQYFVTKDMGTPRYFLGIEFAYAKDRMVLSLRKYVLDILQETCLLGCKQENTPIDQSPSFWDSSSEAFEDVG